MKLLVCLAAIGENHWENKLQYLIHNLRLLVATSKGHEIYFDATVYKISNEALNSVIQIAHKSGILSENIFIRQSKGYLGQFLTSFVTPDRVKLYDYVFLMLDDVKLCEDFDLSTFIDKYHQSKCDILSPCLTPSSKNAHPFMKINGTFSTNTIRHVTIIEFFVYLMTPNVYERYYNTFLNEHTRWMWGIDLALHLQGFSLCLDNGTTIHHFYFQEGYHSPNAPNPIAEMEILQKNMPFTHFQELKQQTY